MGINDNMRQEIAKVAYGLWEKGGCVPGRDLENWLEAERIVTARYAEKGAAKEKTKKATTYAKIPVEMNKTAPIEIKKETPEAVHALVSRSPERSEGEAKKKAEARKPAKRAESPKEGRKTK